ncbi:MAG TPA: MFS transporter [Vicinamibacterales bacterium]|nr:MFS transporter [Vicinamibacterales bacterium]
MTPPSAHGRFVAPAGTIEQHERPAVVASFLLFFCIMAGYFAVRPVRDTVGTLIGADRLANLWIGTAAASVIVIPVYGWLVARFRRSVFLPWTYAAVAVSLVIVGLAFRRGNPGLQLSQFFWIFISVLNLFTISVFWSFLVELFRSDQTKRLFGIIAAGGTAGALAGPLFTDVAVSRIGNSGILFFGAVLFALAIVCQKALIIVWKSKSPADEIGGAEEQDQALGGSMLAGVPLVLKSPYVLGIALFVVLISAANTFLYFDQLRLVTDAFPDPAARTRFFARLDWIVQSLTIVSQLFLTGAIASRVGLVPLLTVVPIVTAFAFAALAASNTLAVVVVSIVTRRFGQFAFVRPGREMLWSALDKETKYKAKNFVDVPVYRAADALFAQLDKVIHAVGGAQAVAIVGAVAAAVWAVNGRWLGRQHDAAAVQERAAVP